MPKAKGFTLVELLITITILAILATVGLTIYGSAKLTARDSRRKSDLRSIQAALEVYRQKNGRYPSTGSTNAWEPDFDLSTCAPVTYWLKDKPPSSPLIDLDDSNHTYINQLPHDPKGDPSCANFMSGGGTAVHYGYAYISGHVNGAACAGDSSNNQYYILATVLENSNDPEVNSKRSYKDCVGASDSTAISITNPTINPNLFVVTNP